MKHNDHDQPEAVDNHEPHHKTNNDGHDHSHMVDNFRINLPEPFSKMKPESIYQHFIQGVQGKVQLKNNKLQLDIYGFQHRDVIAPLFRNLEQKMIAKNIDPRCLWLNGHVLNFEFK